MEEDKLFLLCKGSRYDVYPSGMSSIGYKAYITVIGFPATELVDILDAETNEKYIASIEQQEKHRKEWMKSLGFIPKK